MGRASVLSESCGSLEDHDARGMPRREFFGAGRLVLSTSVDGPASSGFGLNPPGPVPSLPSRGSGCVENRSSGRDTGTLIIH